MIINRLKRNESTLCTYTTTGEEIIEGHVLGYGDNYACVVLYNKFEGKFEAIEFGYQDEDNYPFRSHDMICHTDPWELLGNVDDVNSKFNLLKEVPEDFDYTKHLEEYYKKE